MLQPVGVTADHELVFGERRLRACRDILHHQEIEVRVVDVSSIISGEYAENEMRKDFTPSERVAIAESIRQEIGNRRGINQHTSEEHVQKIAHAEPGQKSRDVAAQKAGFGNRETYRQAKQTVEEAVDEVVAAMVLLYPIEV